MAFWSQRAKVKWLKEGDVPTSYFFNDYQVRKARLEIHKIQKSDRVWIDGTDMDKEAVAFF